MPGSPLRAVHDPNVERETRAARRESAARGALDRQRPATVAGRLRLEQRMAHSLRGARTAVGLADRAGEGGRPATSVAQEVAAAAADVQQLQGLVVPPAPLGTTYDFTDFFRATGAFCR